MKYCTYCGKEIMDEAVICPGCGCATSNFKQQTVEEDKINGGFMALSVLIPLAGVILWPVKHRKSPKSAMIYGVTGIVSWILWYILLILISAAM